MNIKRHHERNAKEIKVAFHVDYDVSIHDTSLLLSGNKFHPILKREEVVIKIKDLPINSFKYSVSVRDG